MLKIQSNPLGNFRDYLPGTKLAKRLENFNPQTGTYSRIITPPINRLDRGCLSHDIAYAKYKDVPDRNIADKELSNVAESVIQTNNSSRIQRVNAHLVKGIMDYKVKHGVGIK